MIICRIRNNAGPGNQMFMYAFAYALAKRNNQKILIISEISRDSIRQDILQQLLLDQDMVSGMLQLSRIRHVLIYRVIRKLIFDVLLKLPFFHWITQRAEESRRIQIPEKLKKWKLYVTDGYWECHAFFDPYRTDLMRQFQPKDELPEEVLAVIREIRQCESVAVHIRKGDFKAFGRLIDDTYYDQAMERLRKVLKAPVFYILSEDPEVKARYIGVPDCRILDFHTPWKYLDEWTALLQCKSHVIANSTYSFWSSYLSDDPQKQVVIPTEAQYLKAEPAGDPASYLNYYPESWRLNTAALPQTFSCSMPREDPVTAFVILNYCGAVDTVSCVDSVKRCAPDCPTVIVDNASPDGSGRYLLDKYREDDLVSVILHPRNAGFSKGNNIGIRYARTILHAAFIVVLNPDTALLQEDFIPRLREAFVRQHFAVLGPMVLDPSGNSSSPLRVGDTDALPELKRIFISWRRQYLKALFGVYACHPFIGKERKKTQTEVDTHIVSESKDPEKEQLDVQLHGCCLIFSPEYFRYYAGYEERTFMYGEEMILKMNCRRTGLRMVYDPELRILHKETAVSHHLYTSGRKRIVYLKRMKDAAKAIYKKAKTESRNDAAGDFR